MRTFSRWTLILAAGVGAAACGSNNNNSTADSRVSDANKTPDAPTTPDANVQVRDGTLAVTQVNLTDPAVAQLAIGGASISLEFDDLTQNDGGNVAFGTGAIGECTVIQYDAGSGAVHKPHPAIDEGTITISGAGLKQPIGPCAFELGQYVCTVDQKTGEAGTYSASNANGGAIITVTGHSFTTGDIGSWLVLSGFTDAGMNGEYPIVNIVGTSAELGVPPGAAMNATNASFSNVGYVQLQGLGPVPGGAQTVDFIDTGSGSDHVEIALAANTDYPTVIDSTLSPIGKGMILDNSGTGCTDCAMPHQFPTSADNNATVSFSCDPAMGDKSGNCGEVGDQLSVGLVITGSTTDASITGLPPYAMPAPVSQYASFTCKFPTAKTGQIPNGAIAAILGTHPTRVETRVFRFAFGLGTDGQTQSTWATVAGHGLVGHTDMQ